MPESPGAALPPKSWVCLHICQLPQEPTHPCLLSLAGIGFYCLQSKNSNEQFYRSGLVRLWSGNATCCHSPLELCSESYPHCARADGAVTPGRVPVPLTERKKAPQRVSGPGQLLPVLTAHWPEPTRIPMTPPNR